MRKLFPIFLALPMLALAQSYSGQLLDGPCYDQSRNLNRCGATTSTSIFALNVKGRVYRFDDAGNAKAADAMKGHGSPGPATATVNATADGDVLKVQSIEVR